MARISDIYSGDSKWLRSSSDGTLNLDGSPSVMVCRIAEVTDAKTKDGRPQRAIHFEQHGKVLGLNVTNARAISKFLGDEDDDWIGKDVELYVIPDSSGMSDSGHCIRVRKPSRAAPSQAAPAAKPADSGVSSKATAWECWKRANAKQPADKQFSKENLALVCKAATDAVRGNRGESAMTADDWFKVAEKADELNVEGGEGEEEVPF
jgi:hypothetical protein